MARADRVPFVAGRRLVAVLTRVNDLRDLTFVVDTGAERTLISRHAASRLGIDLTRPLHFESLAGIGQSAPMPVVRLDRMQVGASSVANVLASVFDLPPLFRADGLLGLNYLQRFRVTLEFDTRTLVLRPRP